MFIDCNPSFSIYTQMALVSSDFLLIPMMADYSSLEGLKGIMTLLYGKYPTSASQRYADKFMTFSSQVNGFELSLPKLWEFIFNNFTSNTGIATAYESIKNELTNFCYKQYEESPTLFAEHNGKLTSRKKWENYYLTSVKDFHTSGKVSASLGIPLHKLPAKSKYTMPNGKIVNVNKNRYSEAIDHIVELSQKI